MVLQLTVDHLQLVRAYGEQTYPHECCGLLLGIQSRAEAGGCRTVVELWSTQNTWNAEAAALMESPLSLTSASRYWIDPKDILNAQRYARNRQLDIIGVYHSHPDHPAVPSECDRTLAWVGYSYMIVSVLEGNAQDLLSWSLDKDHQFQPEPLLIMGDRRPIESESTFSDPVLCS